MGEPNIIKERTSTEPHHSDHQRIPNAMVMVMFNIMDMNMKIYEADQIRTQKLFKSQNKKEKTNNDISSVKE